MHKWENGFERKKKREEKQIVLGGGKKKEWKKNMRISLKRIAVFFIAGFCTTIVLLSIPKTGDEREWSLRDDNQNLPRPILRSFKAQRYADQGASNQINAGIKEPVNDNTGFTGRKIDDTLIARFEKYLSELDMNALTGLECKNNETLREYWRRTRRIEVPRRDSWEHFYANIGGCDLYREDEVIKSLLSDLSTLPVKHVAIMDGGTQVKLILTFSNDEQAVFKPMRFGRDYETDPNHFYFSDFERHHAEIATFHLDKVLGFRRAVPTVGRVFNITADLRDKAEKRLKKTFFISPAKNYCFVSKCDYYCDTSHAICGNPDMKEGSVQVFLPDENNVPRKHNKSPYRRTYSKKNQIAIWQQDMSFCEAKVKTKRQYAHGRTLLDLVDLHILDYLIGNQDRHHFESFAVFDNTPSYAIHLDNGRAFGRTDFDDEDIILPLKQCCVIRPSTLVTLLRYYKGPVSLSEALEKSMSEDPVAPILARKHYPALERRLHKVLTYVEQCITRAGGPANVVIPEYHNEKIKLMQPAVDGTEEDEDEQKKELAKKET